MFCLFLSCRLRQVLLHLLQYLPQIDAYTDVSSGERGLNLVRVFTYIHTACMQAAKALASLRICVDSPEPSLLSDLMSTQISCTGQYIESLGVSVVKSV